MVKSGKASMSQCLLNGGSIHIVLLLNMCVYFLTSVEVTFSINSRGMYIFLKEVKESVMQCIKGELLNTV